MAILVTGGAGYIGSHTVLELLKKGEDVVVIDNLYSGHEQAILGGRTYFGDVGNPNFLERVFSENKIEAVIHFSAYSLVGESVFNPLKYYDNNVGSMINLLTVMEKYNVKKIIFSSTAAVYGEPKNIPILETDDTIPTNPYGETKLAIEKMLKWADKAYGIKYVALRYFNACGADMDGNIGEDHAQESHLIPLVCQVALRQREHISIFGNDYDTFDGTCIRDYVHVIDLAQAHILALNKLRNNSNSDIYNLGSGNGFSVNQVINKIEKISGRNILKVVSRRRPGDPAVLIASSDKIKKELGWNPQFTNLDKIIQTAWNWHSKHPFGFQKINAF